MLAEMKHGAGGKDPLRPDGLADVYERFDGPVYLNGMQAIVRALLLQALRDRLAGIDSGGLVTGYRGSPLGGLDLAIDRAGAHLRAHDILFQPGLNEDLAATAIWGAQQAGLFEPARHDGVFGVWYGKGPGVDRSGDALKHANLAGTSRRGGVLALAGDDHLSKSSTTAHQSEPALIAAGIPILNPSSIEEVIAYSLHGIAMSRFSGAWVALKCLTQTMDSSASVDLDGLRLALAEPADFVLPPGGLNIRRSDTPLEQERRLVDWKLPAATAFAAANGLDRAITPGRKRIGLVTTGKSWLDLLSAFRMLGLDEAARDRFGIGLYKIALVWPLDSAGLARFAEGFEELVFIEEKRPIVEDQARAALYGLAADRRPPISGKRDPEGRTLFPSHGDLDAAAIARALSRRFAAHGIALPESALLPAEATGVADIVTRAAWFCAGCPHSSSTRVPEGSRAGGGIGCHGLAALNSPETTLPYTQMGGEGANWIGRAPFVESGHLFQNLGDGTYNHSGLLAVRAAVAAGTNITYKILFNDAVAMTGGQPHEGVLDVDAIAAQLVAIGVGRVEVVSENPGRLQTMAFPKGVSIHGRDDLDDVQRALIGVAGTTAIIYDQTCATEKRRRRKRELEKQPDVAVFINELVCEGCGDCGLASDCVAIQPVETAFGRKREVDRGACNVDLSCLKGFCPSFVTVHGASSPDRAARAMTAPPSVPEPVLPALGAEPYNILLTGVGGTGIVTIAAILGMAAHLDGASCRVMDQTGMAQKNGAVTSHVMLSAGGAPIPAASVAAGDTDLLLGYDAVGAASRAALQLLRPGRSHALVNDQVLPVGRFARDRDLDLPHDALLARLSGCIGADAVERVDASKLAMEILGDGLGANMLMLGYAWQRGLVPVSMGAIRRAIELNGVAVALNLAALDWGRAVAHDPALVPGGHGEGPGQVASIAGRIADLRRFLVGYQDEGYARDFDALVDKGRRAERDLSGEEGPLTAALADGLFKLMAYKDEYEVARLLSDPAMLARLPTGAGKRLRFHLAPPLLARRDRRTGHPAKMAFGPWLLPVLRLLARLRFLRRTPFDPFGYTHERRAERAAINEYCRTMETCLGMLEEATFDCILALARLPQDIRGFGHVKHAAREAANAERQRLLAELTLLSLGKRDVRPQQEPADVHP
ncbi:MAG: indolepyruvate ferredoxin oxidoreductase family protein [Sphingopyxis sp.]|nr:indolepyruvate ferredoxin oxidoreductase family protein [Sphingopyxis sp.]